MVGQERVRETAELVQMAIVWTNTNIICIFISLFAETLEIGSLRDE
jgi:hypothetical protein